MANVEGTSNFDRIDSLYVDDEGDFVSEVNDFVRGFEGSDVIFGLGGADILDGGLGSDLLFGNEGNDSIFGGAGNDNLSGGTGGDQLNGGDGIDTAFYDGSSAPVSVDLLFGALSGDANGDTLFGIENLTGSAFGDLLSGDNDANELLGGAGNDVLQGRGGADLIIGGAGVDTAAYFGLPAGVAVSLLTNSGGGDTLSEIENLIGTSFGDTLTGNDFANILNGDAGDDILIGGGGSDELFGVTGNDTYREVDGSDIVDEGIGDGVDTVEALVSFSLVNSAQVLGAIENLILLGTANINGTGNFLANVITGNSGANVLAGGSGNDRLDGGIGADRMFGGIGGDLYIVDNPGDVADETGGDGIDGVSALVSFVLGAGLENLTLLGGAAINGTGNSLANTIIGNTAANVLDGGEGADTLRGLAGDDTYVVDNAADAVDENAVGSSGVDTVLASTSFALGNGVENLTLTGAAAIAGTGNELGNTITGNGATNVLTGGLGADRFLFGSALNKKTNVDTIADYSTLDDTILLDNAIFTKLKKEGVLNGKFFHEGKKAHDGNDRIIYNDGNGSLIYDENGDGRGKAVKFAILPEDLNLNKGDFFVM